MPDEHTDSLKEVIRQRVARGQDPHRAARKLGSELRESVRDSERRIDRFDEIYEGVNNPTTARSREYLVNNLADERASLVDLEAIIVSGWTP